MVRIGVIFGVFEVKFLFYCDKIGEIMIKNLGTTKLLGNNEVVVISEKLFLLLTVHKALTIFFTFT